MDSFMGVPTRKIVELILAVLGLIFHLCEDGTSKKSEYFILACLTVAYLAMVVIMICARREIMGGTQAIECALGLALIVITLLGLVAGSNSGLITASYVVFLILGIIFWLAALFGM